MKKQNTYLFKIVSFANESLDLCNAPLVKRSGDDEAYIHKNKKLKTSDDVRPLVNIEFQGGRIPLSSMVQTANGTSFLEESPLFKDYKTNLERVRQAPELNALCSKRKDQIVKLLESNVFNLIKDPELPLSIKQLCVSRLPIMSNILKDMYSRPSSMLLLSSKGEPFFPSYKKEALNLKKALIKDKDQSGITFEGRTEKLFKWCRQELTETRNPLVSVFLKNERLNTLEKETFSNYFDRLNDISNLLILQIGACDDLADTIQDEFLTKCVEKIPYVNSEEEKQMLLKEVEDYRDGIFKNYFCKVVDIWDDSIIQLEDLFEAEHFNKEVKPGFLKIFETIVESLTYSVFLNTNPHNEDITLRKIHDTLAPNIMVCCFRYLEKSLVSKLAVDKAITLPNLSDLETLQEIIDMSQVSAASSNAAATVSRELRENDLSSPFPFAINDSVMIRLRSLDISFVEKFETYIRDQQGYTNGFFATYYEEKPTSSFDYLNLLVLRRSILSHTFLELDKFKKAGVIPPDSDYTIDTLADETLSMAKSSVNENLLGGSFLEKFKRHIKLIDLFSDSLAIETNVYADFFEDWERDISTMRGLAFKIQDPSLRDSTCKYIDSWQDFLCMYLLYKRTFDGTI